MIACDDAKVENHVIREIVFSNLDSAAANGAWTDEGDGHLDGATVREIAEDMIALAQDCEGFTPEQIAPFIREWLTREDREWHTETNH